MIAFSFSLQQKNSLPLMQVFAIQPSFAETKHIKPTINIKPEINHPFARRTLVQNYPPRNGFHPSILLLVADYCNTLPLQTSKK